MKSVKKLFNEIEYINLINNIKLYRKKLGMTQEEFAEKCEISASYVKQIESGKEYKNITLNILFKFSKVLNISISNLFNNKN